MSNIHDVFKDDDVNGTIIGDYVIAGRLFYDGRAQSQHVTAETEDDLKNILLNRMEEIKTECGDAYRLIYPGNKWEIRIDDPGNGEPGTWWTKVYGSEKREQGD